MRPPVLFVEPLPCHPEEKDRCLEDPDHLQYPQELKEELIPWVPFPVERFPWCELSF